MQIKEVEFVKSSTQLEECPKGNMHEYAFIGRSNVGKSSLINMLLERRNMAHTSGAPGKTQCINHFLVNKSWFIADLPGYGYAKVSKKERRKWQQMIYTYLKNRQNLVNTFLLVDGRIPPQNSDVEMMQWLGLNQLPFMIVFTKTDKLNPTQLTGNIETYQELLLNTWEELPEIIISAARIKKGADEILKIVADYNSEIPRINFA